MNWTMVSYRDFMDNHVRLQLLAIAYNTEQLLAAADPAASDEGMTITTFQEKLIQIRIQSGSAC
jgi:hypothetical protein